MPPPAPCPDTSTIPVLNHLTPELQQAMELWFTERIKVGGGIDTAESCSCIHSFCLIYLYIFVSMMTHMTYGLYCM